MQIIKDIEQGTDEWHSLRLGIPTASAMACLLVNGKGEGGFGAGAITYMHELIAEQFTGVATPFAGNKHTERGHEDEPKAIAEYEEKHGVIVDDITIVLNHGAGYSPDGFVGDDGLIECKSKLGKLQVELLLSQQVPKEHEVQLQVGLWLTGREWIDFISYCEGMPTFEKRVYPDLEMIAKLEERTKAFNELMQQKIKLIIDNQ